MMLASRWTGQPVAGWWMSEKFDGVRAFWDGKALRTRTWRAILAPWWFTAGLPAGVALDGELWGGRGTFQTTSDLSRFDRSEDEAWQTMRLMVFDAPTTDAEPIETRVRLAEQLARGKSVDFVTQSRCADGAFAAAEMARIVRGGGEGIVLKRPGSCYEFGRSVDWLKVKPAHVD